MQTPLFKKFKIEDKWNEKSDAVLIEGDSLEQLRKLPSEAIKLIVSSPPYNIGKEYEKKTTLETYFDWLDPILDELVRVLHPQGSICWQVGNFVDDGEVFPLDIHFYPLFKKRGLQLRNRIVWHFDHGLHASKRFSGRYETILWFSKSDGHTFNLDSVRVPSKYPGKTNFKPGPNYGKPSGNPLGKNPSDIWKIVERDWESLLWDIPNVKANHPEKTIHPCQFPIELVERCVLALTNKNDWVLDPFCGVASVHLAALRHERKAIGIDRELKYLAEGRKRISMLQSGDLPYRLLGKAVHQPSGKVSQRPAEWTQQELL
jgi:DNA modification methylase